MTVNYSAPANQLIHFLSDSSTIIKTKNVHTTNLGTADRFMLLV